LLEVQNMEYQKAKDMEQKACPILPQDVKIILD